MRPGACCPSGCAAHVIPRACKPATPSRATSHLSALLQVTTAVHTYDACACRLRWAQLDHEACGLMREAVRRQAAGLAPFENPPPPAAQAAAAPAVSASDPVRNGGAADADDEESEEDLSGVVDVNALRRRLMADAGYTVSAAEEPQVPASAAPTMRPQPAAGPAVVRGGGAPPAVQQAQAPSRATSTLARQPAAAPAAAATRGGATATPELAALSELAAQLSTVEGPEAAAAGALLRPLDGLRQRVDGLQALLHDPAQDQGSKMAEVSSLVGQMQELHGLAQRHQEVVASGRAAGGGDGAANGAANGATRGAADAGAAPRRAAAGADGGLGMGGLDTLDLDGLLQSLEGRGGLEDPD